MSETKTAFFHPAQTYDEAVDRASVLHGIQLEYWDIFGKRHVISTEVKAAILRAVGVPAGSLEELNRALEKQFDRDWARPLPPTLVVAGDTEPAEMELRLRDAPAASARFTIDLEDGRQVTWTVCLAQLPVRAAAVVGSDQFVAWRIALPPELPLGYHALRVAVTDEERTWGECTSRLIVCPSRAYVPEALRDHGCLAGVAFHLPGVRSHRNWGCGDFTDLRALADWVVEEAGASFIALNPLHAIANRAPYNTSPYLPTSVFFRNPLYLDVPAVEDVQASPRAQAALARPAVRDKIEQLRGSEHVEYERVYALKLSILKLGFAHFLRQEWKKGTERARLFREYIDSQSLLLEQFAVYCALDEYLHRRDPSLWVWPDWPAPYRDPDSDATRAFARRHWRSVLFHQYLQWQADLQLGAAEAYVRRKGMAIGLYHDLALATDRCGSDLWAYRSFFVDGCRVGSPPDDFSPDGQDWAFPPPNSRRHWETGYELFRDTIRKNCRHGGALRIDHVMRFFRLFWIPDGQPAAAGTYLLDRANDLLGILLLESVRNRVLLVGEDLGTVEPHVRKTLEARGVLSYRLFYFEKHPDGKFLPPRAYPRQALVCSTTHDLPTLAGFWLGRDIEVRREAGLLAGDAAEQAFAQRREEKQKMLDLLHSLKLLPRHYPRHADHIGELSPELHHAVLGLLASTPSMLMALNQEDLTREPEQQNLPGTTWQHPNWRRKMRFTVEELRTDRMVRDCSRRFRDWLERSGRLNPPPRPQ